MMKIIRSYNNASPPHKFLSNITMQFTTTTTLCILYSHLMTALADFLPIPTFDPTKFKFPPWELKFPARYTRFYVHVICVDTDSKCDAIGCFKGKSGVSLPCPTPNTCFCFN